MNYLRVSYHWYYDLVFRTKYNFLVPFVYVIDFLDYVKAGIAFNTRSYEMSSRKISFYAAVLQDLNDGKFTPTVQQAIRYFYEDIFSLYKNYFKNVSSDMAQSTYVCFIPAFEKVAFLYEKCSVSTLDLSTYQSENMDDMLFCMGTPSVYSCSDKQIRALSIAYDCTKCNDILMEVTNAYM